MLKVGQMASLFAPGDDPWVFVLLLDATQHGGQVDALRRAFELLELAERREVGRAIVLSAYVHELRGGRKRRREIVASPTEAHLPRLIDRGRDSFAVAADTSPGVVWLNGRYAKALKSSSGRAGVGAQRFLALLGAETAPRPRISGRCASWRRMGRWRARSRPGCWLLRPCRRRW